MLTPYKDFFEWNLCGGNYVVVIIDKNGDPNNTDIIFKELVTPHKNILWLKN